MPSGGSKTHTVTQQTNAAPWGEQQGYLKYGFQRAQQIYNDPTRPQFFPGQTYADFSPETESALRMTAERAQEGSPLAGAGKDEIAKTISGAYLDPATNPHLASVIASTKANVLPAIDSRFISAGRTGSGLHGRAVGEGLGSAIGGVLYNNYAGERGRQYEAATNAPAIAMTDYADYDRLGSVGAAREAKTQQGIEEAKARHEFQQMAPYDELARYMQLIQGNYGGTSTTTGERLIPQSNPWATALGLGTSGIGLIGGTGGFGPMGWLTGLLSDERVKEDIEPVGKTNEGLPIYTYRYKGTGGPKLMGVMAQDVAKVKPEAVGVTIDGMLGVDYEQVA